MSLPARFSPDTHVLHVLTSPVQRLSILERLLERPPAERPSVLAIVGDAMADMLPAVADLTGTSLRGITVRKISELMANGWLGFSREVGAMADGSSLNLTWPGSEPDMAQQPVVYVELGEVFARCSASSEMMSVTYELDQIRRRTGLCVLESVPIEALPKSLGVEFFDIHTHWSFAGSISGNSSVGSGAGIDLSALNLALAEPSFRNRFLALARDDGDAAVALTPDPLQDYRRGFLVLDYQLRIVYASPRAGTLLVKDFGDMVNQPIADFIDGVDLVTLKHECGKAAPGSSQTPFVVSWRIAPGRYEPREVTVDAITAGRHPAGHIISISRVEATRRPRTVYRQLSEERTPSDTTDGAEPALTDDEILSDSLHGTQITRREHEIMLFIIQGMSNREIARHLAIAEVTVKKHLTSVYRKLRITNRTDLLRSFAEPQTSAGASE